MDALLPLVDFVLHVDRHLREFVLAHGAWVYALLFAIVFVETGLVVMPFLPGDSLLFVVGALCGVGLMHLAPSIALLWLAAVLGNQTNYSIGRAVGPRVWRWDQSRWFNRRAFEQAHAFYERYGGITLVAARFMPFLRTFAPFVAGVGRMPYARFFAFSAFGTVLWVGGLVTLGYFFGNVPFIKQNLSVMIIAIIAFSLVPMLIGFIRHKMRPSAKAQPGEH